MTKRCEDKIKARAKWCECYGGVCGHGKLPCNPKFNAAFAKSVRLTKKARGREYEKVNINVCFRRSR